VDESRELAIGGKGGPFIALSTLAITTLLLATASPEFSTFCREPKNALTSDAFFIYFVAPAMGIAGVVFGVLAKIGHWRRWAPRYFAEDLPFYLRNAVFALIPIGVMFLAAAAAAAVQPLAVWAPLPFIGLVLASGISAVVICLDPPDELKPDWLLAEERGEAEPPPDRKRYLAVSSFEYWTLVVLLIGLVAAWAIFDLPISLLIAVGMALSLLAAARRRRN
jgi:hypothetical protein